MTPAQITEAQAIASHPDRAAVLRAIRIVAARHLAIRVAHDAGVSMAEIARLMNRDHTTILHAIRKGAS